MISPRSHKGSLIHDHTQDNPTSDLVSDLSTKINRVSRRSLDGSVIMSNEEWNDIVKLVEKVLTPSNQ